MLFQLTSTRACPLQRPHQLPVRATPTTAAAATAACLWPLPGVLLMAVVLLLLLVLLR
jgi:hypothetical protein